MGWNYDSKATGERIRQKIAAEKRKKGDLARMIGRHAASISKYQSGQDLTPENLGKIAVELGCSVDYLLGIGPEPEEPKEKSQYGVVVAGKNFLVTENNSGYNDPSRELKLDIVQRTVAIVEAGNQKSLKILINILKALEPEDVIPGASER